MKQKDLTEKNLETYPDVFADVCNALLYEGKQIVKASELYPAPTETLYPTGKGGLRNQFHDVSKYVIQNGNITIQYTLENETKAKRKTVLRKAGYEGAVYRAQVDKKGSFPFVSCVLYWGKGHWTQPRCIKQMWKQEQIPAETWDYVDNIKLFVYDMRHLSKEVRGLFTSDMRIVVDYLTEGKEYVPTNQKIIHLEAVLMLLRALTGDDRYEDIIGEMQEVEKRKGGATMCELLDKYEQRGMEKGIEKGIEKGMERGLRALIHTCKEIGISWNQTMERVRKEFEISEESSREKMQLYWGE